MHRDGKVFHASDAAKLEDPDRLEKLPPSILVGALGLTPGLYVAEIGAGTGFFTLPIAEQVGPKGRVWAIDVQPEMLARLQAKLDGSTLPITTVAAPATQTSLADDAVDLVFFGSVWHELDEPALVLAEARRVLRPGGRIAILDWRSDLASPPGPPAHHRIARDEVVRVLQAERWRVRSAQNVAGYTYLVIADIP